MVTLTPEMKDKLAKEMAEKAFLASVAKLLSKITFETNWSTIVGIFGFSEEAEQTNRFYQSHYFRDDDYESALLRFLQTAYAASPERALPMIKYVIDELKNESKLNEVDIKRFPALANLEKVSTPEFSFITPKLETTKYIDIHELPDDFYRDLLNMINKAYTYELYVAVYLLTRKMLESLLVDILRKKFGMANLDLFYDSRYHGFKEFRTLITNFESKLSDFQTIIPSLDAQFIRSLNSFREQGNSAAHALEIRVTQKELLDNKGTIEFITKTLVRLFNNC